jgi:hypothetical protein
MDSLDRARAQYPVGSTFTARVTHVPQPGVIGVFLDAGAPPQGFLDVIWLPRDPSTWPQVGDESEFEVLQHREDQMRLWPVDPAWRGHEHWLDDLDWSAARSRLHVGDSVSGRVTEVFTANRECRIDLDVVTVVAEWSGEAPTPGEQQRVVVKAVLNSTRRVLVNFA